MIGETPGLINNEADAYELANKKLEARIEYYKKLREQEIDNIVNANKNIFENNGVTNDSTGSVFDFFNADLSRVKNGSFNSFLYSDYTKGIKDIERVLNKDFNTLVKEYLNNNPNLSVNEAAYNVFKENFGFKDVSFIPSQSEFDKLLSSQTKTLENYYSDYISSYEGSIDKSLINAFMEDMVIGGYDLQNINNKLKEILNNSDFEKLYEDYQLSFSDESLNTEELYNSLKTYFDNLKKELPTASEEIDTFFDSIITGIKDVSDTTNEIITKSLSDKFKDLWNSESFDDAKEDLSKLASESKITASDINDLAKENVELADLLDESGMSAQFVAECFDSMCRGGKGFDAITSDALLLDQVLNGMTGSLEQATQAKSEYDKAMSKGDYNANFKNYQEAYSSAMEMFNKGEYGKHFRDTMEYLLGTDSYTMSIDEMYSAVKNLGSVFGESATNGYEFLDKLWSKKEVLDNLDSSLTKLSDGSYDFDLKPDEFEAIADALGMTTEEVAACTNALGMFGDYSSYDLDELELALNSISIAAHDGEKSITSLQGVENILSDLGYSGYDVYQIMQQIQGMGTIELIDFEEGNLDDTLAKLKELENVKIDGSNIDLDSLITGMQALGNSDVDIANFIDRLNGQFNLTDAEGKLVDFETAKNRALSATENGVSDDLSKVGEEAETTTNKVSNVNTEMDTLNKKTLSQVQLQFVNVSTAANTAKENVQKIIDKINDLNGKKINPGGNTNPNDNTESDGKGYHGTVGNAYAKGTTQYDDIPNLPITGYNGLPKDEKNAVRSEYGQQELTVYPNGKTELTSQPTMSDLPKGTVIFNERQTKKMLNGTKFVSGNAYASGTVTKNKLPKSSGNSSSKTSSSDKDNSKSKTEIDWIARRLERLQKIIDMTKAKFENLFDLKSKSSNLDKQIKQTTKLQKANEKATDKYDKKASSYAKKTKLSKSLQKAVQDGRLDGYSLKDLIKKYGEKTADKINTYKGYWDQAREAEQNAEELTTTLRDLKEQQYQLYVDDAEANIDKLNAQKDVAIGYEAQNNKIEEQRTYLQQSYEYQIKIADLTKDETKKAQLQAELQKELLDLEKQKFDVIKQEYENRMSLIEAEADSLQSQMDQVEARGQIVTANYYDAQIKSEEDQKALYQEEKTKLEEQKASLEAAGGTGTQDWYDMVSAINDVQKNIDDCTTSIINMHNSITEIADTIYDKMISGIQKYADEAEFVVGLMSDMDDFDSETFTTTNEGLAKLGSYFVGKTTSETEANKTKAIVEQMKENLAKGQLSFIDANGQQRDYQSIDQMQDVIDNYYENWRDQIKQTSDYNSKIIDFMRQKLQQELDLMQDLIDSKVNALNAQKSLHDYTKSINESTKNINQIQSQITALQGDNSQESFARIQSLQKQLEDAQEDLQEKQYERQISDEQDMLDNLYNKYSSLITAEMQDTKKLIEKGQKLFESTMGTIKSTMDTYIGQYGYTYQQLSDVFNGTSFTDFKTNLETKLDSIITNTTPTPTPEPQPQPSGDTFGKGTGYTPIAQQSYDPISNNTPSYSINTVPSIAMPLPVVEELGEGTGKDTLVEVKSIAKTAFDKLETLGLKPLKGFKRGGVVSVDDIEKQIKANGDNTLVSANPGERILTPLQNDLFEKFVNNLPQLTQMTDAIKPMVDLPKIPDIKPVERNSNVEFNATLSFPNATKVDEKVVEAAMLKAVQSPSSPVRKAVVDNTIGQMNGTSRLGSNKYRV